MADIQTMIWKEWREMVASGSRRSRQTSLGLTLLILGVLMPLQQRAMWLDGGAIVGWIAGPIILLTPVITDTIVGERERHTLETLLASRLPDRAILFGKILLPVLWSWLFVQIAMLLAPIPIGLINKSAAFYSGRILLAGLTLSALSSGFIASTGVLVSLRAKTMRQAQQSAGLIAMSLIFVPVGLIFLLATILPKTISGPILQLIEEGNVASLFTGIVIIFALLDIALIGLAERCFQRNRLILD